MSGRWRLAVLAGLFALVTACGGGGDGGDGVASVSDKDAAGKEEQQKGSDEDQMLKYAKCMRDHGIDMPDPEPEGGMAVPAEEAGEQAGKFEEAARECDKLLPNGGEPLKPSAKDLDQMREEAKCLREHGLDVPDPTMEDPFITLSDGDGDSEKTQKAMDECVGGRGAVSVQEDGGR